MENIEPTQILRYRPGERYRMHPDFFVGPKKEKMGRGGQRIATLIAWLNSVSGGGGTRINAQPQMALAGGVGVGSADMDIVPLVRVNPRYPPRAQSRGIEGWVHLRFTITRQGTVTDVQVVDADPKGYFERSAKRAVGKYKYKPKIQDGEAVPRAGVELVLTFEIEE